MSQLGKEICRFKKSSKPFIDRVWMWMKETRWASVMVKWFFRHSFTSKLEKQLPPDIICMRILNWAQNPLLGFLYTIASLWLLIVCSVPMTLSLLPLTRIGRLQIYVSDFIWWLMSGLGTFTVKFPGNYLFALNDRTGIPSVCLMWKKWFGIKWVSSPLPLV